MKLNAKTIETVTLPAGKTDHIEWDDDLPGFGVRLRAGGSRNLLFQYRLGEKQRRLSLGPATVEAFRTVRGAGGAASKLGVRERVADLQARVRLGEDPAGKKEEARARAIETFLVIATRYLAAWKAGVRKSTYVNTERHFLKYAKPLHGLNFAAIDQRTIASTLTAVREQSGTTTARLMRSSLHKLWIWAASEGLVDANPVAGTARSEETPRERVLTDDELAVVWHESGADDYGAIIRLLMLTGLRVDEIGGLRRSEIQVVPVPRAFGDGIARLPQPAFEVTAIDLPEERTKNGRPHVVPLSPPALAIIAAQPERVDATGEMRDPFFGQYSENGFNSFGPAKERLDARVLAALWKVAEQRDDKALKAHLAKVGELRAAIAKARPKSSEQRALQQQLKKIWWTTHDLRRTMDTIMNDRLGVLPHVVEACLNHVSSAKSGKGGVAGVYNKAVYLRERVAALKLWADYVMALAGENVVPLRHTAG